MSNLGPTLGRGLYFLITTLIIIAPALYNRYPLVYFDSGAYMEMAVLLEPSFHRAMGYPLMMKITGLLISNWPIVFIQGLLLSVLLFRLVVNLIPGERQIWKHFLVVCLMSFGSAMSWYAAQLMPDVFTLILVLAFASLLVERQLSNLRLAAYCLLIFFALLAHLSNIPLILLVLLVSFLFVWKSDTREDRRKKVISLGSTLLAAIIFTCSFNASHDMGFRLSLASNAFVTANLGEMGILKMYLDENCPNAPQSLCAMKDSLPHETYGYLWDPEGPVQKHEGGWEEANQEYKSVVHDFLFSPRYMKWFFIGSVKATLKQLFQVELGSGLQYAYGKGTPPYWPMKSHFKQELNEYLISVQNKGDELPLSFFRMVNYLTLLLSILIIGRAVINRSLTPELGLLLVVFLAAYFFNAAITGVLANVYERLQCRLLPLVQLLALLIWLQSPKKEIQVVDNQ